MGCILIGFTDKVQAVLYSKGIENIEVNIFNFDRNIYDKSVTVTFCKRIRDDIRFSSKEELSRQLGNDKAEALKILAE